MMMDHYSNWCEVRPIMDHDAWTTIWFLEDESIYRFGVPKFVLIDNGGKWMVKFYLQWKNYGIEHQFIAPQWLQCNNTAKQMIKTLKHGLIVMATNHVFCLIIVVVCKLTQNFPYTWC